MLENLIEFFLCVIQWSERRRFDLAGSLSSILRAQLHAYDPLLAMTLRYLMRYAFYFNLDSFLHYLNLVDLELWYLMFQLNFLQYSQSILHPPRYSISYIWYNREVPLWGSWPSYNFPWKLVWSATIWRGIEIVLLRKPFKDRCGGFHCFHFNLQVDVQALVHAAELTRQDAVDSLRFAKGDLFQAFQVLTYFHTFCIVDWILIYMRLFINIDYWKCLMFCGIQPFLSLDKFYGLVTVATLDWHAWFWFFPELFTLIKMTYYIGLFEIKYFILFLIDCSIGPAN